MKESVLGSNFILIFLLTPALGQIHFTRHEHYKVQRDAPLPSYGQKRLLQQRSKLNGYKNKGLINQGQLVN